MSVLGPGGMMSEESMLRAGRSRRGTSPVPWGFLRLQFIEAERCGTRGVESHADVPLNLGRYLTRRV